MLNNNNRIEVSSIRLIIGKIIVISKIKFKFDISKLADELDCVGSCIELLHMYWNVSNSIKSFKFKARLDNNFELVSTNVLNNIGNRVEVNPV